MSSLDEYIALRRKSRRLAAASLDPETDREVWAGEEAIAQAASDAYADGYTTAEMVAAEERDRRND